MLIFSLIIEFANDEKRVPHSSPARTRRQVAATCPRNMSPQCALVQQSQPVGFHATSRSKQNYVAATTIFAKKC